ncbi:hypothetical protein IM40_08510 [Candidatus Paracaedimonas acanthamoebae]|nr:hypothetical protein IM40_08510 [Candidatus Paracaedimonas acanthamoebae]
MEKSKLYSLILFAGIANCANASYPIPVVPLTDHPEPKLQTSDDLPYEEKEFPCNGDRPLENGAQAAYCVEHKFQTDVGLYNFAQHSNHLGDVTPCRGESHFSKDKATFEKTLKNAKMKCQLNTRDNSTFFCVGKTTEEMCYMDGSKVFNIRAVINKNNKNFVTFSPSKAGPETIK